MVSQNARPTTRRASNLRASVASRSARSPPLTRSTPGTRPRPRSHRGQPSTHLGIPEHALSSLDKAYKAWWKALKSGRRAGPPRFKARGKCRESFTTHGIIKVDATGITLPRLGRLRIKGSTRRVAGRILTATVSRTADRWFLSLTAERDIATPTAPVGGPVGIDVGLTQSLVLSTGEVIQGPRALKVSLAKLRRAQKAVARSQRSSNRRKAKVAAVAGIHARVANIRNDWLHNVSDRLTREHAVTSGTRASRSSG